MESLVSQSFDRIIATRADESTRRDIVTLSRINLFLGPLTDSIRRELDARLPREGARVLPPVIQNSTHAVSERKHEAPTGEQWCKMLLAPLRENKDEPIRKRPLGDRGKLSRRDERDTKGNRQSEF